MPEKVQKAKKKIKVTELVDADVQFISLVDKGANQIPIRVLKSKEGIKMKLENLFKKELSEPFVSAFIVNKDADVEKARKIIEKSGFTAANEEEKEDVIFFHQKSAEEAQHTAVLKVSEEIGVHVALRKGLETWDFETTSFRELFDKQGVIPNILVAHDVLKEVILNALFHDGTDDPAEAAGIIKVALDEFSEFVTSIVESIPVSAFKIDDPEILNEVKKEMTKENENKEAKEVQKAEDASNKKEESNAEAKEVSKEDTTEEEKGEELATKSNDSSEILGQIAEGVSALTKEVASLKESVSGQGDKLKTLEDKVEEVSGVAKSADEAINGVTNTNPEGDKVQKSEKPSFKPLRDTGYSRVS